MNELRQPKSTNTVGTQSCPNRKIRHHKHPKQIHSGTIIRLIAFIGMIAVLVIMSMLRKF